MSNSMALEHISPSRFICFTFPNPTLPTSLLRIAVLDSPSSPSSSSSSSPQVAAMSVPIHREADWIFSTQSGHIQLLLNSPGISRLILFGNQPTIHEGHSSPPPIYRRLPPSELEVSIKPLLLALSPKSSFKHGIPDIPILSYEDNINSRVVLGIHVGSFVGEMMVEDVEIEEGGSKRDFRRRLRFKRMPNLVQTQIRIVPKTPNFCCSDRVGIGEVDFKPDHSILIHPYLAPMVASLKLIGSYIEELTENGFRTKALCLGIGGGALLSFLKTQLSFEVVGVEVDEQVLNVATQYFGLENDFHITVYVGDAIEFIKKLACRIHSQNSGCSSDHRVKGNLHMGDSDDGHCVFDVLMVDLDSSDVNSGLSAPTLEFMQKDVLLAVRSTLSCKGILVINVIPSSLSFYEATIRDLRAVFSNLYEIDVGNGENFVLVAVMSPIVSSASNHENSFLDKLRTLIPGALVDSIKKIGNHRAYNVKHKHSLGC